MTGDDDTLDMMIGGYVMCGSIEKTLAVLSFLPVLFWNAQSYFGRLNLIQLGRVLLSLAHLGPIPICL